MTDAEVITAAVAAALFMGGNFVKARHTLQNLGYIQGMLSRSRFNRRQHRLHSLILI